MTYRLGSILAAAIIALAPLSIVRAHPLDEYVQATLVEIVPPKISIDINLTPGIEVADEIIAQIDTDADGRITSRESALYGSALMSDVTARLDGQPIAFDVVAVAVPQPPQMRSGWGTINVRFESSAVSLQSGEHTLDFANRHFPAIAAYLFNAAKPQNEQVRIVSQTRNRNQSKGQIVFDYQSPDPPATSRQTTLIALGIAVAAVSTLLLAIRNYFGRRAT